MNLAGRVTLEVNGRQRLAQRAHRLQIPVEVHVRALAVDEMELVERLLLVRALRLVRKLCGAERVGALLPRRAGKRAKPALHAADLPRRRHLDLVRRAPALR